MLSGVVLSVVMLSVTVLSVAASIKHLSEEEAENSEDESKKQIVSLPFSYPSGVSAATFCHLNTSSTT